MKRNSFFAGLAALLLPLCFAVAQEPKTAVYPPDAATMAAIHQKITELRAATEQLHKQPGFEVLPRSQRQTTFCWNPMVDVFLKAAESIVGHNEFLQKDSGKQTLAVLDEGLRRAKEFPAFEKSLRTVAGRTLACGYRSTIDNSSQPYVVSFPINYGKDPKKKWRLDIVLHGRDGTLTEVKMLAGALKRPAVKPDQDYIQVEVFGRGNNAYRWAGETDVYEAFDALMELDSKVGEAWQGERFDRDRVVLRGFSMGGAGTWHIGLHNPFDWCVIGPGAGFTTTHGYIKNLPAKLPPYQEACLHIYDAVDYAENAAMVPVVAYAGDKDAQQQAAINIENILKPLGIPMTRLVGTGLAHQFPPEWQKKAQEAYAPFVQRGRNNDAKKIHFVTYTLSYPNRSSIRLIGLEQHYVRTRVDAKLKGDGYEIETKNVRKFLISIHSSIAERQKLIFRIDGQTVPVTEEFPGSAFHSLVFSKEKGVWQRTGSGRSDGRKDPELHGPIDDAFKRDFLCIQGTGKCASPSVQAYTDAALDRFRREWEIYFRGALPILTDREFLAEEAKYKLEPRLNWRPGTNRVGTLVLFGDPSSNSVLRDFVNKGRLKELIQWNADELNFGGKAYAADRHVPAFIFPSPERGGRYIVVNSGHTFHAADLQGTNALLYPRLGDFAILKPTPTAKDPAAAEVIRAGLFDENWKVPAEK